MPSFCQNGARQPAIAREEAAGSKGSENLKLRNGWDNALASVVRTKTAGGIFTFGSDRRDVHASISKYIDTIMMENIYGNSGCD